MVVQPLRGYVKAIRCSVCEDYVEITDRSDMAGPCSCGRFVLVAGIIYGSAGARGTAVTLTEMFGDDDG